MRVLIVDDNATNIALIRHLVVRIDNAEVISFSDPAKAVEALSHISFDLALIDYMMPEINGIELINRIKAIPRLQHVPIVMVTTADEQQIRIDAITAGANDFLTKPIEPIEFKARVRNLLALREAQNALADRADWLADKVAEATQTLARREEEIVYRLTRAVEGRDAETGAHVARMATTCHMIAEELGLSADECRTVYLASFMHDIGKVQVPDSILHKPGALSEEERRQMELHTLIGESILQGSESQLIQVASQIAGSHHERWDGTGYPRGLKGEAIPLQARIASVADVFDALISARPYKPAWHLDRAREFLVRNRGTQFAPDCIDAFLRRWNDVVALVSADSNIVTAA